MARPTALIQLKAVRLSLGGAPLFEGVDVSLARGERAALVGANGAGKSTLLRILLGDLEADSGERALAAGAHLAVVAQEPDLAGHATLRAYVTAQGAPEHRAEAELMALDLDPDRTPDGLSGGEQRRAALARAFAADPDILLLDEPTNHLDIPAIEALEARLANFRGAGLIVSHDRRFLERISTSVLWLRQRRVIKLDSPYTGFETWAEQVETEEARELARLETQLKAEEHWLRRGVTARRARNEGRRRKLFAMRAEHAARLKEQAGASALIEAERGRDSGKLVIEAKALSKSFGETPVVSGLSLRLMRGDRLGIVGPNGAGKSTLIDLLLGRLAPDQGLVRRGANVDLAYVDQRRSILDPTKTLTETLTPLGGDQVMVRGKPRHVAAYARDFLFTPAQMRQPVSALSGGERNRLALAVVLAQPANLLVLDEPTNDLDMDTLEVLEEAVAEFDGAVIIVSHDRAFLDATTTQVIGALGQGRWAETPGGYGDFMREHGARIAAPAERPMPGATPAALAQPAKAQRKLSYKDERRLAEIEALTPKLEAEIIALEAKLADATGFARDPAAFAAAAKRLEAAKHEKDAAETEWLEIEAKRESLTG
jgi:ATP-binding cassette subfamily F protein uup